MLNFDSSDGSILISQDGCNIDLKVSSGPSGSILTQDSPSIILSGNGTTSPLMARMKISLQSGNYLIQNPDGMYVGFPAFQEAPVKFLPSNSITAILSGTNDHTIQLETKISQTAGNKLVMMSDGMYVADTTGGPILPALSADAPLMYNTLLNKLTINQATAISSGFLSSTDWSFFNSKEPAIIAGNTSQYWRGDKTWQLLNTLAVPEAGSSLYFTNARFDTRFATKSTDDLLEGVANLYFTTPRARLSVSAISPLQYNSSTGIFSITQSNSVNGGYLTSGDWSFFSSKVTDTVFLGSSGSQNIVKQKNSSNNLEIKGIKAGNNTSISLIGDDIVISAGTLPLKPTVNAGSDQSVASPTSSVTMAASVSDPDGSIASFIWEKLSGPTSFNITDRASLTTTITDLATGTYAFRLYATDQTGLTSHDDIVVQVTTTPVLDTIYWGAKGSGTVPIENEITSGLSNTQNGALDVTVDWTSFNGTPQYVWFAIPDLGGTYVKNKWYVDAINNGNIGTPSDLFGAYSTVTVGGDSYIVGISNYATQFTAVTQLQKV